MRGNDPGNEPTAEKELSKKEEFRKHFSHDRSTMVNKFRFLILAQISLTIFLILEVFKSPDMVADFRAIPPNLENVICRFLCAIFLHINLSDELAQGLNIMKYSMNHPWKFKRWHHAFFVGFWQMAILVSVEFVNMMILLTNSSIVDTLMNFLALTVITEFDDYYFSTI